jgi:hypothetical protein
MITPTVAPVDAHQPGDGGLVHLRRQPGDEVIDVAGHPCVMAGEGTSSTTTPSSGQRSRRSCERTVTFHTPRSSPRRVEGLAWVLCRQRLEWPQGGQSPEVPRGSGVCAGHGGVRAFLPRWGSRVRIPSSAPSENPPVAGGSLPLRSLTCGFVLSRTPPGGFPLLSGPLRAVTEPLLGKRWVGIPWANGGWRRTGASKRAISRRTRRSRRARRSVHPTAACCPG